MAFRSSQCMVILVAGVAGCFYSPERRGGDESQQSGSTQVAADTGASGTTDAEATGSSSESSSGSETGTTTGETTAPPATVSSSSGSSGDDAAVCGDGVVAGAEECDDGNPNDGDACTNACEEARCGDTIIGPGEQCDDGNHQDGDDCTNDCTKPACGDHIVSQGEQCDDGNGDDSDACPGNCQPASCGDGFVQAGVEECDDGNLVDGDGCTAACVKVWSLVGGYDVNTGPSYVANPPTYTCKEACALLFGGPAGDYVCSVAADAPSGLAYLSGWNDAQFCTVPADDDFKMGAAYNCGFTGCAYSAFVADLCLAGASINYCWR